MPRNGGSYDEDFLLLYPGTRSGKFNRFPEPHFETPIVKGVASQLRKWPADLFLAFLAACLIIGCLAFLIFVTVVVCLPATHANRVSKNLGIADTANVYFLKLENQSWSARQFCHVEHAVQWNPNLQFYMINLLTEQRVNKRQNETQGVRDSSGMKTEEHLRNGLISKYPNVRNIEVSIEAFFKGSKLAEIADSFDDGMLETAAKAQLLWNSPGIALNTDMYCNLKFVKRFLCTGEIENCVPSNAAAIEPTNDIQVAGVPCQAFMGFLIDEMWRNRVNRNVTLLKVLDDYCARRYYCPGITVFHLNSKCPRDAVDCPIVSSTVISLDQPHTAHDPKGSTVRNNSNNNESYIAKISSTVIPLDQPHTEHDPKGSTVRNNSDNETHIAKNLV